ncbi:MAG: hypothetical protein KDD58_12625 [Bdellovibrionales bacterium]|nr:hypothetical protein [Bdellovibrionales bacterium]
MVSLTFRAVLLISKILFFIFLSGCASQGRSYDGFSPISRVYNDDFENVWRAAQLALQKYPMRVNNIDKGLLETDWVKGYEIWVPPVKPKVKAAGARYKIILRAIKGKSQGESAIKVSLQKKIEKKRDFFAEVETPPSDGLEESAILYRIGREIQIDHALQMAQEKMNN